MCCIAVCCAKCCLSLCNTIVIFIGLILCALGGILLWGWATIQTALSTVLQALTSTYNIDVSSMNLTTLSIVGNLATAVFIVGVILVAIGVFGYVAACCSCCKPVAIIYIVIMSAILAAEILFVIIFFAANATFAGQFKNYVLTLIQQNYVDVWQLAGNFNLFSFLMNLWMVNMQCCGINNWTDYQASPMWNRTYTFNATANYSLEIPYACCVMTSSTSYTAVYSNCTTNPTTTSTYMNNNCYTALANMFGNYLYIVVGVLGGLGLLLLLPISCMCCICKASSSVGPV